MNKSFYKDFIKIPFYRNHAYMIPFVGDNYISTEHKKLLLIGESHYLLKISSVHHDAYNWYYGKPHLTSGNNSEENNCTPAKTWGEGRNTYFCINVQESLCNATRIKESWNSVAFYNYFLRPANFGKGINDLWTTETSYRPKALDIEFAVKNLIDVLKILKPDLIVFLSKMALDCTEQFFPIWFKDELCDFWEWTKNNGISDYIYTNHPSTTHWLKPMNKNYKKANGKTSKDFFEEWIKQNW